MNEPELSDQAAPPIFNVPAIVLLTLAVLAGIHVALQYLGEDWQIYAVYLFSFIPSRLGGGDPVAMVEGSQIWSFFTYAFLHGSWFHLLSNSLWLLVFATPVSRRLGALRFIGLALVSAAGGALAMLPLHWGEFIVMVGASGSVSGCMAAATPIMFSPGFSRAGDPKDVAVMSLGELARNRGAIVFMAVFIVLQLATGTSQALTGTAFIEESVIAWEAHLGGFLAGLLFFYAVDRGRRSSSA